MSFPEITGFEIIEKLGEGGMASVWKARQVSLDRTVAIKVLSSQFASDAKDIDRFQKEAQAAAKLKHPGIIQVYDANAEGGIYFFVMEYVAGYTVGDWVRRRGVLGVDDALLVVECIVDALDYAWHTAGIIHCDIKPDNIIIDADGTVKVADLGLARTISAMAEAVTEEIMGTPAYMAPEQVAGVADLDCRADIYSLGSMLYHLITGRMLFQGSPEESIMDMQLQDCVPDALDVNEEVGDPVCWILERMLAKDRNMRHPDWESVRRDIERVKEGNSPAAHLPDSAVSTMLRSKKRTLVGFRRSLPRGEVHKSNAGVVAALVSVLLVLAAGGGAYWFLTRSNGDDAPSTDPVKPVSTTTTTTQRERGRPKPPKHAGKPENAAHEKLFLEASEWARLHPREMDEAIRRFDAIADTAKTSKYGDLAAREADRLRSRRDEIVENIVRGLRSRARLLVEAGKLLEAAAVYEGYEGAGAEQTRDRRLVLAAELKKRAAEIKKKREQAALTAGQRRGEMLARIVNELAESRVADAEASARQAATDGELGEYRGDFATVVPLLTAARREEASIILGFQKYAGKIVTVDLENGPASLTVTRVRDGKVEAVEKTSAGDRHFSFTLADLSSREKLMRLGQSNESHVALLKGIMALRSNAYTHAAKYFKMIDGLLAEPLLESVEQARAGVVDREAEKALRRVLRTVSISVDDYDGDMWLDAVSRASITEDDHQMVRDALDTFERAYGTTGFAKKAAPVVERLREKVD